MGLKFQKKYPGVYRLQLVVFKLCLTVLTDFTKEFYGNGDRKRKKIHIVLELL